MELLFVPLILWLLSCSIVNECVSNYCFNNLLRLPLNKAFMYANCKYHEPPRSPVLILTGSVLHSTSVCGSAPCDPSHHRGAAQQHPLHGPLPRPGPRPRPPQQRHGCHGDGGRNDHGDECRWVWSCALKLLLSSRDCISFS